MRSPAQQLFIRHRRAGVLRAVLAVFLLVQTGLLAHELNHVGNPESPECMLCILSDHAADTLPVAVALGSGVFSDAVSPLTAIADGGEFFAPYAARAPPVIPIV